MKTKINLENKARFFSLYWGQEVLSGLRNDGERELYKIDTSNFYQIEENWIYLNLKPLSQISDEDAIEIGYQQCNDELNFNYGMSPSGCFLDEMGDMDEFLSSDADYLRSRGYALPWMGISVEDQIEAGWVKLTEL